MKGISVQQDYTQVQCPSCSIVWWWNLYEGTCNCPGCGLFLATRAALKKGVEVG
jgi:hypothetical protein